MQVLLVAVPRIADWQHDARAVRQRLSAALRSHLGDRGLRLVGQPRERVEVLLDQGRARVTVEACAVVEG